MDIILFGQLTDITGIKNLKLNGIKDTLSLVKELNRKYPALEQTCYLLAVDKTIVVENTVLNEQSTIALMPPFAGG
jgi:sulfur-carrier protein